LGAINRFLVSDKSLTGYLLHLPYNTFRFGPFPDWDRNCEGVTNGPNNLTFTGGANKSPSG
jgi:hypothetical protein